MHGNNGDAGQQGGGEVGGAEDDTGRGVVQQD